MPIPTSRPTGTKPWGILGYLKDFISPPGYVSTGPFGSRKASAAELAPTDAQLKAQGYGVGVREYDPLDRRSKAPTDAELKAQGYGFGVREYNPLEKGTKVSKPVVYPSAPVLSAPVATPAGVVQPGSLVSGLTPSGTVDYSQSDEYKSQMAQYRNLISQKKTQEAEDLGMQMWMQKYGGKLGLTGPSPLMEDFGGFVPTQGPTPAVLQASEAPLKAFGQEVKTYFPGAGPESFSPLDAQDQQQEATAAQADMATTVKLPVRNRVQAFLQGGM